MPIVSKNIDIFKSISVQMMFTEAAEKDYMFARFPKMHGIYSEFWWKAAQTVEKCLKAIILLNGGSVKKYRHDLSAMFDDQKSILSDMALSELTKPEKLNPALWYDESLAHFIGRIAHLGDPDSRYGLIPIYGYRGDLFKFDELYFQLRRRCYCMDRVIGDNDAHVSDTFGVFCGKTFGEVIRENPRLINQYNLVNGHGIVWNFETVSDINKKWNVSFEDDDSEFLNGKPPAAIAALSPGFENTLLTSIYESIENPNNVFDPEQARQNINWLLANVIIPKDAKDSFRRWVTTGTVKEQ